MTRSIWFTEPTDPKLFRCSCGRSECDAPQPTSALLRTLDAIRSRYGRPVIVRSGPRCAFWNQHEGGKKDSEHLTGDAADLACEGAAERWHLLRAVLDSGVNRIGVGQTFLHVGVGELPHPQDVIWTYPP